MIAGGIARTSLHEVAASANLPAGSVLSTFGEKDVLLEHILDRLIDRIGVYQAHIDTADPEERLGQAVAALLDVVWACRSGQRAHVAVMQDPLASLVASLKLRQRHLVYGYAGLITAAVPEAEARELAMPAALNLMVIAAIGEMPAGTRAVVNVNCLNDRERFTSDPALHDFACENLEARSSRREKNWMPAYIERYRASPLGNNWWFAVRVVPIPAQALCRQRVSGAEVPAGLCAVCTQVNREIVTRSDIGKFVVLPTRWIVERTIARLNRCRRLAKSLPPRRR